MHGALVTLVSILLSIVMSVKSQSDRGILEAFDQGYTVNESGELISPSGSISKLSLSSNGYLSRKIWVEALQKRVQFSFHRFVAYCKFGNCLFEDGIQVRHLDGNKLNNCWDNIEIGTQSQNTLDIPSEIRDFNTTIAAKKAGLKLRKLSCDQVTNLRQDRENGMTYSQLSDKYGGLSYGTIYSIVKGKTYKELASVV